jgi:hypothetical protein
VLQQLTRSEPFAPPVQPSQARSRNPRQWPPVALGSWLLAIFHSSATPCNLQLVFLITFRSLINRRPTLISTDPDLLRPSSSCGIIVVTSSLLSLYALVRPCTPLTPTPACTSHIPQDNIDFDQGPLGPCLLAAGQSASLFPSPKWLSALPQLHPANPP